MGRSTLVAAVLVLLGAADAAPQATVLHLGAGRSGYDALQSFSTSLVAGLSHAPDARGWTSLTVGVPLSVAQDPFWVAAAMEQARGVALGPARVGVDLSLEGYGYRDPLSGVTGVGGTVGALPALRLDGRHFGMRVRAGVRAQATEVAGYAESRTVQHTDLTVEGRLGRAAVAGIEVRRVRSPEAVTPFLGGYATLRHARGEIRAEGGRWMGEALDGTAWSLQGALALSRGLSLTAGAAHQPMDPLYLYEGRTSWSLGVSRALGGGAGGGGVVPVVSPGERVRIVVPAAAVTGPLHVAGEFSGWKRVPMERVGDEWVLELALDTGAYRYAVVDGNGRWFVPDSSYRRDDGMGGEVALIIVSD